MFGESFYAKMEDFQRRTGLISEPLQLKTDFALLNNKAVNGPVCAASNVTTHIKFTFK